MLNAVEEQRLAERHGDWPKSVGILDPTQITCLWRTQATTGGSGGESEQD